MHHRKEVWQLAWPLMLSNLALPIFGLVDTAVLGHLDSPHYLGAVAIGSNLIMFLFWGFGFLRMGTTGVTAQFFGRSDPLKVLATLAQSILAGVIISFFLITIQHIYFDAGLSFMSASDQVSIFAREYLNIRIYSAPAILTTYAFIGWFIGQQNTRIPLVIFIVTNAINIIFDLVFVIGLGWGVKGAALASLIAEYSGLLIAIYFSKQYFRKINPYELIHHIFVKKQFVRLLAINQNIFLRTILLLFSFIYFTKQGAKFGDIVLAANAVLINFLFIISHGLDGFAHASEALTGKAIGQNNIKRFYGSVRSAGEFSFFMALLLSFFFFFFGVQIILLLTNIHEVANQAIQYLPWIIALPLLSFIGYLLDGVFIGTTKSIAMRNSMVLSVLFVFIPLSILLEDFGNNGLWFSFSMLMLARSLSMASYYWYYSKTQAWLDPGNRM